MEDRAGLALRRAGEDMTVGVEAGRGKHAARESLQQAVSYLWNVSEHVRRFAPIVKRTGQQK